MYAVSWEDAANYDVVLNLAQVSMENAATVLMNMAQLPDFQMTPASRRSMEDLRLAARARTMLAQDERSHAASVKVRADNGVVNVTYLPQDARLASSIPEVCKDLPGASDIRVTMAMTNLLWIQEEFQPQSELYDEVVELATKWNAAVELIRPAPEEESPAPQEEARAQTGREAASVATGEYDGGIEEDVAADEAANGGLKDTLDELARIGRSGGGRVVYGDPTQLVDMLDRSIPYTLVVLGDLFLSKGHAARLRATRDLRSFLSDRIKAPVVTTEELEDSISSASVTSSAPPHFCSWRSQSTSWCLPTRDRYWASWRIRVGTRRPSRAPSSRDSIGCPSSSCPLWCSCSYPWWRTRTGRWREQF